MTKKILIPYNFTSNDEKSLDFITSRYLNDQQVHLTLYHAYQPVPEISSKNDPIMNRMNQNMAYLRKILSDQEEEFQQVKASLTQKGFSSTDIECVFTPLKEELATDIINQARTRHCDAVVLNRNPSNIINYFTKSISKTVSNSLAPNITVHIVT